MTTTSHAPSPDSRLERGAVLWIIAFGTIVLWLAHVGAEISLAGYSRTHPRVTWVMDALTITLATAAGSMTVVAWRIAGRQRHDASHVSVQGRIAFLAWMGVFVGVCDVVLIVVEGVYLVTIHG